MIEFHDMGKSIAAYRCVVDNSECEYVQMEYRHICHLGRTFIKFNKCDYAIEVLEVCIDQLHTWNEKDRIGYLF